MNCNAQTLFHVIEVKLGLVEDCSLSIAFPQSARDPRLLPFTVNIMKAVIA
jgi:hypothetical protein